MEKYNHRQQIQIRFSDIDPLNHVNNSCIFQYFDLGRIHYMEDALGKNFHWSEITVVIVHINADFLLPILASDDIEVETKLVSFGNRSMKMQQQIIDRQTLQIKSKCETILAGFNRNSGQSAEISSQFKQYFLDFEDNLRTLSMNS